MNGLVYDKETLLKETVPELFNRLYVPGKNWEGSWDVERESRHRIMIAKVIESFRPDTLAFYRLLIEHGGMIPTNICVFDEHLIEDWGQVTLVLEGPDIHDSSFESSDSSILSIFLQSNEEFSDVFCLNGDHADMVGACFNDDNFWIKIENVDIPVIDDSTVSMVRKLRDLMRLCMALGPLKTFLNESYGEEELSKIPAINEFPFQIDSRYIDDGDYGEFKIKFYHFSVTIQSDSY